MFGVHTDSGFHPTLPGIQMKTLCHGAQTLLVEFRLARGASIPEHRHPHEQTGYLVSGRMLMQVEQASRELLPGDSWSIPSNAAHQVKVLEDTVVVEVFSPLRTEYLVYENPADVIV